MKTRARPAYIRFLPLLAVYVPLVWLLQPREFTGDEGRYAAQVCNLLHGHFSPPGEVNLINGPGYPLALLPFAALRAPVLVERLFNAFLAFGAAVLLYGALREYVSARAATLVAYVLGLHPLLLQNVSLLLTETLAVFLVCATLRLYIGLSRREAPRVWHYGLAAAALAWLALTKVFFGYVVLACLLFAVPVSFVWRARPAARATAVTALALLLCAPYLAYTYGLTGKGFYWATSGGSTLYWISSPYEGDLGEFYSPQYNPPPPEVAANHGAFFRSLPRRGSVEWDDALRREAVKNLATHPACYARNVVANVGRLFFNYPYAHKPQKLSKLYHIVPGAYLLAAMTVAFGLTLTGWSRIPGEVRAILGFGSIAFGGTCLLTAEVRYLLPLLPIALFWVGYTFCLVPGWGPSAPEGRAAHPTAGRREEPA